MWLAAKAADYIKGQLAKYGYTVQEQSFNLPNGRTSYNIFTSKTGKTPNKKIILGAHYDTKSVSPGANDNASGTGLLLELAKYYRLRDPNQTLTFVFFGSEEMVGTNPADHHFGSRHYVKWMSALDKAQTTGMINVDMVGVGTAFNIRSMQKGPMTLINELLGFAKNNGYSLSFLKDLGSTGWSDHEPFELAGIPVAWLEWRTDPYYHTKYDTYDRIQWDKIDKTASLIYQFLSTK